jgi:predicted alpha/beta-fold hydrolase
LDCRDEAFNERAKRLWLPMVADLTRLSQLTAKWANRLAQRLSRDEMIALLRSKNVVEADQYAAVVYNGYRDIMHYYADSGALGDIPWEHRESPVAFLEKLPKVTKLAIPLCALQAFDDPISTFRTIVGNEGFMKPDLLVRLGTGYLVVLLTQRGGHVGWPVGWRPWRHKWKFMSEAAISFVEALTEARASLDESVFRMESEATG